MIMVCWLFYETTIRESREPSPLLQEKFVELKQQQADYKQEARYDKEITYFSFDPNVLEHAGWVELGFSQKQAASIINYRNAGATFKVKRDVAKLFVVSDEKYKLLEPYIQLPDVFVYEEKERSSKRDWKPVPKEVPVQTVVELNGASAEELERLPHIGPKTAAQIISFRDLLGGFHHKEQLSEVYYLRDKPEAVTRLMDLVEVAPDQVRQIPVNECEPAALADHPFISWKQAKALVYYRNHHGPFENVNDIQNCKLITDDLFRKIAPYLTVE